MAPNMAVSHAPRFDERASRDDCQARLQERRFHNTPSSEKAPPPCFSRCLCFCPSQLGPWHAPYPVGHNIVGSMRLFIEAIPDSILAGRASLPIGEKSLERGIETRQYLRSDTVGPRLNLRCSESICDLPERTRSQPPFLAIHTHIY